LHQQLFQLNQSQKPTGAPFEKFEESLEEIYRSCWTDNADYISILYTGTPALKTDFTRTGKRTKIGEMNDGKNSLIRYYINNFTDGYNHDCLDVATKRLNHKTILVSRPKINPFKMIVATFTGLMVVTYLMLNTYWPYP